MTWREIWKSTVTNLRALLGIAPPPRSSPLRSSTPSAAPAPIVKYNSTQLAGSIIQPDRVDPATHPSKALSQSTHPTIDLAATRQLPSHSAPLRRKPSIAHIDVALDDVAFAALQRQRA